MASVAMRDYTHSTAPNRRYPDLITLRMVKSVLSGNPPPYGAADLQALALHCTQQEDAARKVERRMRKSEAALLLQSHIGQTYDAIVTGRTPSGTFVRVFTPPVEGMLIGRGAELDVGQLAGGGARDHPGAGVEPRQLGPGGAVGRGAGIGIGVGHEPAHQLERDRLREHPGDRPTAARWGPGAAGMDALIDAHGLR